MRIYLVITLVLITYTSKAQQFLKYNNEFINLGAGARSIGMAGSVIATNEDVNSAYWNPAGLNGVTDKVQASLMHSEYFKGIVNYDHFAISYRIDTSSIFAFTLLRSGIDNIQNTLDLFDVNGNIDYSRIRYFSVADYAFLFTYSRKLNANFRYGASLKIIYRKQGEFASAMGFGFDAGIQYKKGEWLMGANARDITTTFNFWTYHEDKLKVTNPADTVQNIIPDETIDLTAPQVHVGIARKFLLYNKLSICPEIGLDLTFDGKSNSIIKSNFANVAPHLGVELNYANICFLRAGVGSIQEIPDFNGSSINAQPSVGIGLRFGRVCIDYAITSLSKNAIAMYSNIFSLRFGVSDWKK